MEDEGSQKSWDTADKRTMEFVLFRFIKRLASLGQCDFVKKGHNWKIIAQTSEHRPAETRWRPTWEEVWSFGERLRPQTGVPQGFYCHPSISCMNACFCCKACGSSSSCYLLSALPPLGCSTLQSLLKIQFPPEWELGVDSLQWEVKEAIWATLLSMLCRVGSPKHWS